MNAFLRHHQDAIAFSYRCFDRLLCNAFIPHLPWGANIVSFFRDRRHIPHHTLTPAFFRSLSGQFHRALEQQAEQANLAIVEPPAEVRREDWVAPYYRSLDEQPGVAVLLRCRERARVAISYPKRCNHLELAWRFVNVYYVYLQDAQLGRLWLRLCPYFPFNAQVCFNAHEWLARQLQREGIAFRKDDNAFLACANPQRLPELADAFGPEHVVGGLEPWLAGYQLSQLRYDLGKLRGKGLVRRLKGTQRYERTPEGYRVAVLYQKLYHKLYGPLTAGLLEPVARDGHVLSRRKAKVDRLYEAVDQALQKLSKEVGIVA
jgi:hypothetical protein